jgi:hypothetical protein
LTDPRASIHSLFNVPVQSDDHEFPTASQQAIYLDDAFKSRLFGKGKPERASMRSLSSLLGGGTLSAAIAGVQTNFRRATRTNVRRCGDDKAQQVFDVAAERKVMSNGALYHHKSYYIIINN